MLNLNILGFDEEKEEWQFKSNLGPTEKSKRISQKFQSEGFFLATYIFKFAKRKRRTKAHTFCP